MLQPPKKDRHGKEEYFHDQTGERKAEKAYEEAHEHDEASGAEETTHSSDGTGEEEPAPPAEDGDADAAEGEESQGSDESPTEPSSPDGKRTSSEDDVAANVADDQPTVVGHGRVEAPDWKGPKEGGPNPHEKKVMPDAKGGTKKRLESAYGDTHGVDDSVAEDESAPTDKAAASKPALGLHSQSGKQEGLTNTDTKFAGAISDSDRLSYKGEGAPETSKLKGTVDPARPPPEQRESGKGKEADKSED
ncbi:MAG: hypothetical protein M1826_000160 [Phylliscum demangeonii]|nr:MAG: hypothetical protein M1826_000160 [Phylliscum demangeonii]